MNSKSLEQFPLYSRYLLNTCWVDGWMDGWMDRWMDRWMDGWMDGWTDVQIDGCTDRNG
jgi:hypothetical protein